MLTIAALLVSTVFAQSGAILTAEGYSDPAPLLVAPGQVTTFFFRGIGPLPGGQLRAGQATTTPLPTALAGLSMRIAQGSVNVAVPIFAVRQENDCDVSSQAGTACLLTLVKLQIPFEIAGPEIPGGFGPVTITPAPPAQLTLNVDGQAGRAFPLQPVADNAHLITTCDISWDTKNTSVCERSAYHADGRPVTASEPAKRGETIVVYAQGLGQPSAPAPTGDVSPAGGALENIQRRLAVSFDNFLNTPSSVPRFGYVNPNPSPIAFAGLTPGEIGLYQINIPVPLSLDLADQCGGLNGFIHANATLFVSGSQGTELLGLCVQP